MKLVLIITSILALVVLVWLLVMPSFTAAMKTSPVIDLPVQKVELGLSIADVTIIIQAADQFSIDGKVLDFEGLKKAIHDQTPSSGLSVRLICDYAIGFETMIRVSELLRTAGIERLSIEQKSDRPNQRPETNAGKESVSPTTPGPGVAHP